VLRTVAATGDRGTARSSSIASSFASVLLVLDAPVLEPDFHLLFGESERGGDLDAAQPRQVLAGGELVLEAQQLGACERRAKAFCGPAASLAAGDVWRITLATVVRLCIGNC